MRGKLVAWVLSVTGDWWGLVELELTSRNGKTRVTLRQAIDPVALREVDPAVVAEAGDETEGDVPGL
ncbi:hypothetical protein [Amycolatopsis sp.]|uniref:hypothetical protein n=1 Tax=Amycolatopsis sp. TaxID=37632 RepID=UPI002D7E86A3|nr:hypothetical protein [Amycolatopsis sp.]HET6705514.1 hypothetical protein [Amycolatopsis sp.]